MAVRALTKGAVTFLEKPADPEKLQEEIRKAVALNAVKSSESNQKKELARKFRALTPREKEVLKLVSAGLTNKEIAERLNVALTTVKMHRGNATEKLELHSAAEITRALIILDEALDG